MHLATPEQMAEIARPFVDAKKNLRRDPASKYGGYLPRTERIDITRPGVTSVDASVTEVTADGVTVFFYNSFTFIPWADVRTLTVRHTDADGNTLSAIDYVPAPAMQVAA